MIEQPKKTDTKFGEEYTHPAYAQISASRVSGGAVLYASEFQHQNYIRVRIAASTSSRSLSNDRHSTDRLPYIEVDMSEAQWATFVSAMNVDGGSPCTLRRLGNQAIPELPNPQNRRDQFAAEAKQSCERVLQSLESIIDKISGMSLSAKAKKELIDEVHTAHRQMVGTLPFVLDQFAEHMERVVEKAKMEINTHFLVGQMRAGQGVLQNDTPPVALTFNEAPADNGSEKA